MKFTKIVKADENNQKNLQIFLDAKAKAEQIASKYGYEVNCSSNLEYGVTLEHPFEQVRIAKERFWPEGKIGFSSYGNGDVVVDMQTSGYSGLDFEEFEAYLDHCHKALECLKELKETFFK